MSNETIILETDENSVTPQELNFIVIEDGREVIVDVPEENFIVIDNEETIISDFGQGPPGPPGAPGLNEEEMLYAKRVDFASDEVIYRGEAAVGASDNAAVWRIRRITIAVDGDVNEQWAEGVSTFGYAWTDRLSLTYL